MKSAPYYANFLCRELKLVIELDGHCHDVAPARDEARDRWMVENGFTVLRFANAEVAGSIEGVVTAIRSEVHCLKGLRE